MHDCAFYMDSPTIDDELKMKRKLQREYDHLFEDGWRSPLENRKQLLTWACEQ